MTKRCGFILLLLALAGCSRAEAPNAKSLADPAFRKELLAHFEMQKAVEAYALASDTEQVEKSLSKLEQAAADDRYPQMAARAHFTIGHACSYSLDDDEKAIEHFQKVIKLLPSDTLARLAEEQIEVARRRTGGAQ